MKILNLCCRSKQSSYDIIDLLRYQTKSPLVCSNFGTTEMGPSAVDRSFHRFKQTKQACMLPRVHAH